MSVLSPKFCLFKRSIGYHYIAFRDGVRTRPEALKALSELNTLLTPKHKASSLKMFSADFLSYAKATFALKTQQIYRQVFDRLKAQVGDCHLCSLTQKTIDEFITRRIPEKIAPVSVNIELRELKAALNTTVRWQLLERNPFAEVKQLGVPERVPELFAREEFTKLLQTIDGSEGKKKGSRGSGILFSCCWHRHEAVGNPQLAMD